MYATEVFYVFIIYKCNHYFCFLFLFFIYFIVYFEYILNIKYDSQYVYIPMIKWIYQTSNLIVQIRLDSSVIFKWCLWCNIYYFNFKIYDFCIHLRHIFRLGDSICNFYIYLLNIKWMKNTCDLLFHVSSHNQTTVLFLNAIISLMLIISVLKNFVLVYISHTVLILKDKI